MGRLWRSMTDVERSVEFVAGQVRFEGDKVVLDPYVLAKYRQILRTAYVSHAVRFLEGLQARCPQAVSLFEGILPKEGGRDNA